MGCNAKDKNIKFSRRPKSSKPPIPKLEQLLMAERALVSSSIVEWSVGKLKDLEKRDFGLNPNPNFESSSWGYLTEDEIEEILISNLDCVFNETVSKLVDSGYRCRAALRAVLKNGKSFGGMEVLNDMWRNCSDYLRSDESGHGLEMEFDNLRQLEEVVVAGLIVSLQKARPNLSKGDAMWCLLMSNLHMDLASKMEVPMQSDLGNGCSLSFHDGDKVCKFHGGHGFNVGDEISIKGLPSCHNDAVQQKEFEFPERYNLTPAMKSLLKQNAEMFAAGFRAKSKQIQEQLQDCPNNSSASEVSKDTKASAGVPVNDKNEGDSSNDLICSVLNKFRELNLKENQEFVYGDHQDKLFITLIHQIKVVERQVKDRKEWANEKAIQAAKKLCNDLIELRKLRMEREKTLRLMNAKHVVEDNVLKQFSDLEDALRKASAEVDRADAVVHCLEAENAELKAEMEASKLSRSESITTCLEVAKKEKKCLKRVLACEKQKTKFQEEIASEKKKIEDVQHLLAQIELADKEAEVKWRMKQEAKEQALARVIEEQSFTKLTEANCKRRLADVNLNIERDFQRHKDDKQRLEDEFSQLKASIAESTGVSHPKKMTRATSKADVDAINASLDETDETKCMICLREDVGVLFIPCAHIVLCCICNDGYGKKGKATCPCCRVPIQQRVRIFGPNS